jgi:two-component system cell cycle sensor histidine kinase/response regulator CckA
MVSFGDRVFQALFDPVADPILVLRGQEIEYLNDAAARLLDADAERAIGRNVDEILGRLDDLRLPTDVPQHRDRVELRFSDGRRVSLTLDAEPLDIGPERLTRITLVADHDEIASPPPTVAQVESPHSGNSRPASQAARSELKAIFRALPDHFLRIDDQGRILEYNAPDNEAPLPPLVEAIGRRLQEMVPLEVAEPLTEAIETALGSERVRTIEHPLPIAGATRWYEARIVPYAPDRLIVLLRDITDRKQSEEQTLLARKLESIERLAGGIAHEFNNLLTAVVAHGELARLDLPPESPAEGHVAQILRAAERAGDLTRKLLAFSRSHVADVTRVDVRDLLEEVLHKLQRRFAPNVQFRFSARHGRGEIDAPIHVLADPKFLVKAIENVVANGSEAMPHGGILDVALRAVRVGPVFAARHFGLKQGQYVAIFIRDGGLGMDDETRRRAFDPFFSTKRGAAEGRGLGLPTAHGIVKQLGGQIFALSKPGRGTTIAIYLPRAGVEPKRPIAPLAPRDNLGRVLLVEDEPAVREILARILRNLGYRVTAAENGLVAERVAVAAGHPFDLLVTDVVMPHVGGRELAERLRAHKPDLRVLFVSGYTHSAFEAADLAQPFTRFLQKPFAPNDLARELATLTQVD